LIALIAFLKRMLAPPSIADDRVVIDQESHYDRMEANCRRLRALDLAVEKEQGRIAVTVGSWARDTVSKRDRAQIQRTVRREVAAWLPGLSAEEVMVLARASAEDLARHSPALDDKDPTDLVPAVREWLQSRRAVCRSGSGSGRRNSGWCGRE
jgi:hypothetical protein